jgi:hypothetical protein
MKRREFIAGLGHHDGSREFRKTFLRAACGQRCGPNSVGASGPDEYTPSQDYMMHGRLDRGPVGVRHQSRNRKSPLGPPRVPSVHQGRLGREGPPFRPIAGPALHCRKPKRPKGPRRSPRRSPRPRGLFLAWMAWCEKWGWGCQILRILHIELRTIVASRLLHRMKGLRLPNWPLPTCFC